MSSRRDSHGHKSCANCQSRPAEKGRPDSLCTKCVHKLPRSQCHYCRIAIHVLARHADRPASQHQCDKCSSEAQLYGVPRICQLCKFQAAFDGPQCRHCQSAFERFGAAVRCDKCAYDCAFNKDAESLQKVDGQTLCFLCTHAYKSLRKKEAAAAGAAGESLSGGAAQSLKDAWAKREPEKRPREEDVEAERQRQQQHTSNKRQRTEAPSSSSAAAAAGLSSAASASPSPSPSPQPARASPTLGASLASSVPFSLHSPGLGPLSSSSSSADLLARIAKLEKENADLRRGNEERTQKLLILGARAAESKKLADDAVSDRMRRDKEVNQLRGELEAAKRALVARKDQDASKAQTEALRTLAAAGPNPNHATKAGALKDAAAAAVGDDDDTDIHI